MPKRNSPKKINRSLLIVLILCLIVIALINQHFSKKYIPILPDQEVAALMDSLPFMLPPADDKRQLIQHFAITLAYDEAAEQPAWVAYRLTAEMLKGELPRKDNFRNDPAVSTESASLQDYQKSGYHRGHMAPAADMNWHETALNESFFLSNICPQNGSFNSGLWRRLEEQTRSWAQDNNSLIIVTGPVLTEGLKHIGPNEVSVPKYFYKVILDTSPPEVKGIGFVMKNKNSSRAIREFAVTIDSVEQLTNIDFFYQLPDSLENLIESNIHYRSWGL